MADAVEALRDGDPLVVYGTIRLVERDEEAVLAWAREPWACIIFNLHTPHDAAGLASSAEAFGLLIDIARPHGGSFYLTYHRFASLEQVEACHPRFREFVAAKRRFDPDERFTERLVSPLRGGARPLITRLRVIESVAMEDGPCPT